MSDEQVRRLRAWHDGAYEGGRRDATLTVEHLGWTIVVPPEVYPPNPLGLAESVLREVTKRDRVLDMGTGSGVNAIAAASRSRQVIAVDVNPVAVACARENAARNGLETSIEVRESDLFQKVPEIFDLIVFDPPYRWFRPRDMRERATADENYATLTAFFDQARDHLAADGRILLSFGTTGDVEYLRHLIKEEDFRATELRRAEFVKDDLPVAYFVYRLTP